jgi:hypothetical protein
MGPGAADLLAGALRVRKLSLHGAALGDSGALCLAAALAASSLTGLQVRQISGSTGKFWLVGPCNNTLNQMF